MGVESQSSNESIRFVERLLKLSASTATRSASRPNAIPSSGISIPTVERSADAEFGPTAQQMNTERDPPWRGNDMHVQPPSNMPSLPTENFARKLPSERAFGGTGGRMPQGVPRGTSGGEDISRPHALYRDALRAFQRKYVINSLKLAGWNASEAARRAGVHRNTFQRIMQEHQIPALPGRKPAYKPSEGRQ